MRFSGLILGEILGVIQDYLGIVGKNYWDNFSRRPCKCDHMHPLFFLSVCFRTASRIISIRPLPITFTSESVHGMFMERGFVGGLYEIFSVNFRGNLRYYLRSNYDYLGIVGTIFSAGPANVFICILFSS